MRLSLDCLSFHHCNTGSFKCGIRPEAELKKTKTFTCLSSIFGSVISNVFWSPPPSLKSRTNRTTMLGLSASLLVGIEYSHLDQLYPYPYPGGPTKRLGAAEKCMMKTMPSPKHGHQNQLTRFFFIINLFMSSLKNQQK